MKCLVFSDSHRDTSNMRRALSLHPDAEVVFFLGDGVLDAHKVAEGDNCRSWQVVSGNCDTVPIFKDGYVRSSDSITLEDKRIAFTHGHLVGAKGGFGGLLSFAKETGASIVLFGHTHEPTEKYFSESEVWLFNPGSIACGSYGIMTLTDGGVLFSHGKVNGR